MSLETVDEIELDICQGCGGTWYDRSELEQRLERHLKGTGEDGPSIARTETGVRRKSDFQEVRYLSCPRCSAQMQRKNYGRVSGVIVDVCVHHGLFLDAGEFDKLTQFQRSGGEDKTRRAETTEAKRHKEVRKRIAHLDQDRLASRGRGFGRRYSEGWASEGRSPLLRLIADIFGDY